MKIKSYLGFAYKSGSIILGIDNLMKSKTKIYLFAHACTVGDNTLKQLTKLSEAKQVALININHILDELFKNKNVKVVGVTDANLASAILTEVTNKQQ